VTKTFFSQTGIPKISKAMSQPANSANKMNTEFGPNIYRVSVIFLILMPYSQTKLPGGKLGTNNSNFSAKCSLSSHSKAASAQSLSLSGQSIALSPASMTC